MKTIGKYLSLLALPLIPFALPSRANAQAAYDCIVSFDDTFALSNYLGQARGQFGVESHYGSTGKLEACPGTDNWQNCWAYRQRCSYTSYYVNYWPWGANNHHHVPFDSPYLQDPFCVCDPKDGYDIGYGYKIPTSATTFKCYTSGPCPMWKNETRPSATLGHLGTDWTYVYVENGGDRKQHVFYLEDITIAEGFPIQLWYVDDTGTTWGWPWLSANAYYTLDVPNATAVWIGNANGSTRSPARIIDIGIWPQR